MWVLFSKRKGYGEIIEQCFKEGRLHRGRKRIIKDKKGGGRKGSWLGQGGSKNHRGHVPSLEREKGRGKKRDEGTFISSIARREAWKIRRILKSLKEKDKSGKRGCWVQPQRGRRGKRRGRKGKEKVASYALFVGGKFFFRLHPAGQGGEGRTKKDLLSLL